MSVVPSPTSGSVFNQIGNFTVAVQIMIIAVIGTFIVLIAYTLLKKSKRRG